MRTTARLIMSSLMAGLVLFVAAPVDAAPPPGSDGSTTRTTTPPSEEAEPAVLVPYIPPPDLSPTLSAGSPTVVEGDAGTVELVFPVSLSSPCAEETVFYYDIKEGAPDKATADVDFDLVTNATLTIPAGETEATVSAVVHGDPVPEPNEAVELEIFSEKTDCGVVLGTGAVLVDGFIIDDDVHEVSIDDVETLEGDAGTTTAQFTVSLDEPAEIDGSLQVGLVPGTATADVDHADWPSFVMVFLVGEQHHTVEVDVIGDLDVEDDETYTVVLQNDSFGFEIVDGEGLGTILDDDGPVDPVAPVDGEDPTEPEEPTEPETPTEPEVLGSSSEREALPFTGATVGLLGLIGTTLVAGGGALRWAARRR